MTLTRDRTVVLPPREKTPERPPRPSRTPVRWLGWTFAALVVAAGATLVVLAMLGGETFEEMYEAESPLAMGAIHEPGYVMPQRWVGESDMTLEEFEIMTMDAWVAEYFFLTTTDTFETLYEAESGLAIGAIHEPGFDMPVRWVGESDGTLEELELGPQYSDESGPRF